MYANIRSLCDTPETNMIHPILGYHLYVEAKTKDTNGLKYKTGIDPQTEQKHLQLPRRKGDGEGQIRSLGLTDTLHNL